MKNSTLREWLSVGTKKAVSVFLALALVICIAPLSSSRASAVTFNDINNSEVFLKQPKYSVTCTLYSATMMIRRAAIATGNSNWRGITPDNVSKVAWYSGGLYYKFSYAGISVDHAFINQSDIKSYYISLLKAHPQGVVAYNRGQPHAVLLTDYDANTDTFYCADPNPWYAAGRIPLSQSSITGSSQYDKLNRLTDYWYVSSPSISIQDPIFSTPQNIGDDFYAAIIKMDGWRPLAPVNGKVQVVDGTGDASEIWHFMRQSDNSYVIYNCKSHIVLGVAGAGTSDGTQIQEQNYYGSTSQHWYVYGRWSGEYILKPKHCDKVLDIYGNGNAAGTKVELWTYNGGNAQKLAIYKYDKVGPTEISATPGTDNTETTFKWTKADNAKTYNLRIRKGTPGNVKTYKDIWNLKDTSYSITLPEGYYEVYVDACTVYHYSSSKVIPFNIKHTHSYTSEIDTPATCTSAGVKTFTCSCGDTYTEEIPALEHSEVSIEGKGATCSETGLTDGVKCSVCGEVIKAQEDIPALGHSEVTIEGKSATCSETGLTDGVKCSVCGEVIKAQEEIPALGHSEETIKGTSATCTEKGLTDGVKCSVCGEIIKAQEDIPALGHSEVTIEGKSATCSETGLTDGIKCSVCGEVIKAQEDIPALGHSEVTIEGKSATCTEKGLTDGVKCSVCGEVIKAQKEIAALGHKFDKGVCTVCGAIDPDYKVVLESVSEQIKVDNKSKVAVFTPASNSGIKIAEFKKQFNGEINVNADDNTLIANGAKFKFNNTEFTVIVKGDVNGDGKISALDARTILRISAKLDKADDVTFSAADVNSDGKVTAGEARRVLRFSAKLEKTISN